MSQFTQNFLIICGLLAWAVLVIGVCTVLGMSQYRQLHLIYRATEVDVAEDVDQLYDQEQEDS